MFRKWLAVFGGEGSCRALSAFPKLQPSEDSCRQMPGKKMGCTEETPDQTSLKKSLSSQITEQSGETTKVSEGREEAREAGLDRKSSTWKQGWFTKLTVDML